MQSAYSNPPRNSAQLARSLRTHSQLGTQLTHSLHARSQLGHTLEIQLNLRTAYAHIANLAIPSKFDSTYAQPTHIQPTWPYPRNSTQLTRSLRARSQLGHTLEIRLNLRAAYAHIANLAISSKFDATYAQPAHTQPTQPCPRNSAHSTQLARNLRTRSQLGHTLEIRRSLRVACAHIANLAISSKFNSTYAQPARTQPTQISSKFSLTYTQPTHTQPTQPYS